MSLLTRTTTMATTMASEAMNTGSVPSGHGYELVTVIVYEDQAPSVISAFHKALEIVNVSHRNVRRQDGSFGNRRNSFHPRLVQGLEILVNDEGQFFDVISVIGGVWAGLQAVAVGSNSDKRKRAGKIALAIAAVRERARENEAMENIHRFMRCIQRRWVRWEPEIHRHWDLLSRQTVKLLLLCQLRRSSGGLAAIRQLLISDVLPFMMPHQFEIW